VDFLVVDEDECSRTDTSSRTVCTPLRGA
jgi:hypothetical protein